MNCEYVQNAYGVPACIGRKVSYKGRSGIISMDRGNYIGVTFDDEKQGAISNFHPETEGLEYLGMDKEEKMNEKKLSPAEDVYYHAQCEYPGMIKTYSFSPMEIRLPRKPSLRTKIRRCINILFDRTYKR